MMNGSNYKSLGISPIKDNRFSILDFSTAKTKYVKIIAKNFGKIPSGKPGAGENAWLFCDEIQIK